MVANSVDSLPRFSVRSSTGSIYVQKAKSSSNLYPNKAKESTDVAVVNVNTSKVIEFDKYFHFTLSTSDLAERERQMWADIDLLFSELDTMGTYDGDMDYDWLAELRGSADAQLTEIYGPEDWE